MKLQTIADLIAKSTGVDPAIAKIVVNGVVTLETKNALRNEGSYNGRSPVRAILEASQVQYEKRLEKRTAVTSLPVKKKRK